MSIYTHTHHIIPRHAGGTDDPSNLVELTIEDHAIAHEVRYRMFGDERDAVAARMIRGQISGYDAFIEMVSRPKSDRWKEKARERNLGEKNPMYGKTQSDKQKEAVSRALKGKKKWYKVADNRPPPMFGKDNGKSRAIYGDGRYWESIHMCAKELGVNHNAIRYRLNSDKAKWNNWHYA